MAGTDRPCVVLSPSGFLVWDPRHIYVLRCSHRLVGALLGPPPSRQAYRQAADNGAPLSLSFEETLLAAEEGIADVVDGSSGTYGAIRDVRPEPVPLQALRLDRTERELQRAHVFRQLWARGHRADLPQCCPWRGVTSRPAQSLGCRFGGSTVAW